MFTANSCSWNQQLLQTQCNACRSFLCIEARWMFPIIHWPCHMYQKTQIQRTFTTHLCHHQKTNEETNTAYCQKKELASACVFEKCRKHVADSGNQSLQIDKLKEEKRRFLYLLCEFHKKTNMNRVSVSTTSLSTPRKMIITKKKIAQSCGNGIRDTARGKAMNASPGPAKTVEKLFFSFFGRKKKVIQIGLHLTSPT